MTAEAGAAGGRGGHSRGGMPADLPASLAIAGVVALSATLVSPSPAGLVPGFLALALLLVGGHWPLRRGLRLAWRLKWFLLSLLFFFGWLSPGAGATGWGHLVPSLEGLGDAGLRIAALLSVVFWVAWLTSAFERPAQIRGLSRWLMLAGVRGEAFARRLFLALDLFEAQQTEYRTFRQGVRGTRWSRLKAGREFLIERLDQALAGRVDTAGAQAGAAESDPPSSGRHAGVRWQVALLWLAVAAAVMLRVASPAAGV
ncbi:hypothetical protein [Thioalkalivibrio sp.]|uniref:hypothetical protein n=1 Tax=Thioalkalivibrio sp. TaxID=2093813 RepID=UPI003564290A